jgi:hypothetical protein
MTIVLCVCVCVGGWVCVCACVRVRLHLPAGGGTVHSDVTPVATYPPIIEKFWRCEPESAPMSSRLLKHLEWMWEW